MTACSSCGRLGAVSVVLEHRRRDEKEEVEWRVGACCWSTQTVKLADVKATSKGRQ